MINKSKFPPMSLINSDNSEIESITSLLYRFSYFHRISTLKMVNFAFEYYKNLYNVSYSFNTSYLLALRKLILPNESSKNLITVLSNLIHCDLSKSNLWFFEDLDLTNTKKVSNKFRWCNSCFLEWERNNSPLYYKLSWSLNDITHCSIHKTKLEDSCTHCGANNFKFFLNVNIGTCRSCKKSLFKHDTKQPKLEESWNHTSGDLETLIFDSLNINNLPSNCIHRSFNVLFEHYWGHGKETKLYTIADRDKLLNLAYRSKYNNLDVIREVALIFNLPLSTLLTGEVLYSTESMLNNLTAKPQGSKLTYEEKVIHYELIESLLRIYLDDDQLCLRPFTEIAKNLNIQAEFLSRNFPKLTKDIKKKYQLYLEKERLVNMFRSQKKAIDFVLQDKKNTPSKEIYNLLSKVHPHPKTYLMKSINTAIQIRYKDSEDD